MRQAVRHFQERGGGVLVTLSSWAAQRGAGNPNDCYGASKGAIQATAKTIARDYAREGMLRTHSPGRGAHAACRSRREQSRRRAGDDRTLAMGEWVPPAEVAELVAFLATGEARQLPGATLDINGASYIR